MKNPLCSVIITSYNRENLIVETLNSVFLQTYRPIELIIIEDGSKDSTANVIEKWINSINDQYFKVIFQIQENKGAPKARNTALSLCTGDYIQEVGSDDLLHYSKLELQISTLEENKFAQSAWNPLQRFYNQEKLELSKLPSSQFIIQGIENNPFDYQFFPSAALHRAVVFKNTGEWDEGLKRWQDLIYQVRMTSNVDQILVFDTPLYFFRQHNFGRINDQYKNQNGITNGLVALDLLDDYLTKIQKSNFHTRREIFYLYYSLFQTSIINKDSTQLILISSKLIEWSPNCKLKIKSYLLNLIILLRIQNLFIQKIIKI